MSGGILSRLRRRRSPEADEPIVLEPVVPELADEPAEVPIDVPEPVAAAPEPPPAAEPAVAPDAASEPATPRSLPSFRPVAASTPATSEPLSVTLSEAIELVQGAGGDVIELRFLRRELDRRRQEGSVPADLWPRIEKAVGGRLRRVGKLAEGQPLVLQRDA